MASIGLWRPRQNEAIFKAKEAFRKEFLDPIRKAPPEAQRALLLTTGIVGVGLGERYVRGMPTGEPAIKVLVRTKLPAELLAAGVLMPREYQGALVDVGEVGEFVGQAGANPLLPLNPVVPGCSVGYQSGVVFNAGTLGAVTRNSAGGLFLMSNNHVLAERGLIPIGTPIIQPGSLGALGASRQVGTLAVVEPLNSAVWNAMDAALAAKDPAVPAANTVLQIGNINGVGWPAVNMSVHKFGKGTGYRAGWVRQLGVNVPVTLGPTQYYFTNQITIEGVGGAFSNPGDSGSLVVDRATGRAVALLFAGDGTLSLATPLPTVLSRLGVTLA